MSPSLNGLSNDFKVSALNRHGSRSNAPLFRNVHFHNISIWISSPFIPRLLHYSSQIVRTVP